jgi:signal transduction histidine kinase
MLDNTYLLKIFKANPFPSLLLLPDPPHFTIVDVCAAYLKVTGTTEEGLIGKGFFEVFPDNPEEACVFSSNLIKSLCTAIDTRKADRMATRNYGIHLTGTDKYQIRYWEHENIPILDDHQDVRYILHCVVNRMERQMSLLMNDTDGVTVNDITEERKLRKSQEALVRYTDMSELVEARKKIAQVTDQSHQISMHLQNVREEERKRIAREIHDDLGQQLSAIHMDVVWIDKQIQAEATQLKGKLKNIITLLDGSHQSLRRILSELRPGILDDHGLLDAIVWLGDCFTENTGIPVTFITEEIEVKSSESVANCIFRVYQEALTNITRYAVASAVSIALRIVKDIIVVVIEDNGIGFDPASLQRRKSFGLLGMKERVVSLGGEFELATSSGKGTRITIQLPGNILN